MKLTDIKPGVKLELEVYNDMNERIIPTLTSQFEGALDNTTAVIYAPIHEGNIYPLHIGWTMVIYFLQKENLYSFSAKLLDRKIKDQIALLSIELTTSIERIQRRQFFRFECNLPIKYRVIESTDDAGSEYPEFMSAFTVDISGGGVCIKLKEHISLNKLIECELELEENNKIVFMGEVVRSSKREEDMIFNYDVGISFKDISNRDKDNIVKYIFCKQRKLRKKGLI